MKFLNEYRDAQLVKLLLDQINQITKNEWNIMEICGGQTHSLVKNGIIDLLPDKINMIHGPGCPVCVTPVSLIDNAVELAKREGVVLCSFGDMLRVPGSSQSLLEAKAKGAEIMMVYSPLDVIKLAIKNPEKQYVFFAVGFETTAPANALAIKQAEALNLDNFSILTSHVLVPPAMEAILADPDNQVHGFLAAGHVCTIMGNEEYYPISTKYQIPIVITGFEPVDLLQGIFLCISQLEKGIYKVENQYKRVVSESGNKNAIDTINQIFTINPRSWRGLGIIPNSGYELKPEFQKFNAKDKFSLKSEIVNTSLSQCLAGDVLKGKLKPFQCPYFGKECDPEHPRGAPMVSSEGACAAYYHYYGHEVNQENLA